MLSSRRESSDGESESDEGAAHGLASPRLPAGVGHPLGDPIGTGNRADHLCPYRRRRFAGGRHRCQRPTTVAGTLYPLWPAAGVNARQNVQWFTGHYQDPGTGLVYMGARWYNPEIGRFYSIDPVGFDEGNVHSFNRYAYGNNNPFRFLDPDGKEIIDWSFMIKAGLDVMPPMESRTQEQIDRDMDRFTDGIIAIPAFISMGGEIVSLGRMGFRFLTKESVKAGGGAKIDNIPEFARNRIQDFADKYGTDVTVVGSRAKKVGGNGSESDWDYIVSNPPGKLRKRGSRDLPKGRTGGEMGSGQDFLDGPLDPERPYITFSPNK